MKLERAGVAIYRVQVRVPELLQKKHISSRCEIPLHKMNISPCAVFSRQVILFALVGHCAAYATVATLAGVSLRDGSAGSSYFARPGSVACDQVSGLFYVADTLNSVIRQVTIQGTALFNFCKYPQERATLQPLLWQDQE